MHLSFFWLIKWSTINRKSIHLFIIIPKTQLIFFLTGILVNMCLYIPVPLYFDLQLSVIRVNTTTYSVVCNFIDTNSVLLISYLDLLARVLIPFVLMTLLSTMLTWSICSSRRRIVENFLAEENQTYYKEIKLAFSSICLNLI